MAALMHGWKRSVGDVRLPYLHITRVGRYQYAHYRRDGLRLKIAGAIGSPEFIEAYNRIHAQFEKPSQAINPAGSLGELIRLYRLSPEYRQLGAATRGDYDRVLRIFELGDEAAGVKPSAHLPVATMPKAYLIQIRNQFDRTPRKANYIIQVASILGNLAVDLEWRQTNPAENIRKLKTGAGHRPWEEAEIAAYREHWPADSQERVAFELLLNTGQRRGDIIRMTRASLRDGWISVAAQEKTGARVDLPVSAALAAVLTPWLRGHDHLALLVDRGAPFRVRAFSGFMRAAFTAAGLPKTCTIHGLRYTTATVLHELGLDDGVIADVLGHETMAMAKKYRAKKRQTRIAIERLDRAASGRSVQTSDSTVQKNEGEPG